MITDGFGSSIVAEAIQHHGPSSASSGVSVTLNDRCRSIIYLSRAHLRERLPRPPTAWRSLSVTKANRNPMTRADPPDAIYASEADLR